MRESHGWVRLHTESLLLGLDSFQFHLYHLARLICTPQNAKEEPGLLDLRSHKFSDDTLATVMKCSRRTVVRVKKELLEMGLVRQDGTKLYVVERKVTPLHNHKLVLEEIAEFFATPANRGVAAQFVSIPRRSGQRQGGKQTAPPSHSSANDNCAAQSQHCAAQSQFPGETAPPSHSTAPPSHSSLSGTRYPISKEDKVPKKRRRRSPDASRAPVVPIAFSAWREKLRAGKNPVVVLVEAFRAYHPDAPPEDLSDIGGRLAGMAKTCSRDWGYMLLLIYQTGSANIAGSHLNYLQKSLTDRKGGPRGTHQGYAQRRVPAEYTELEDYIAGGS